MSIIKKRTFQIIQAGEKADIASRLFDIFIIGLIMLNVVAIIVETFTIPEVLKSILSAIETISVIIFTVEYMLRLWTADLLYPQYGAVKSRIKYVFSFMAIIDLLAILPFYIPFVFPIDLRVLRALRIIRLFRLFKVGRYTSALNTIADVFRKKSSQLLSSFFVVALLMIISSILMYSVEHDIQPEKFKNAFSGLWWAVATFTTVGYGDIYPVTAAGKILSSVIALLGIGLVAVPTGIISAGFIEVMSDKTEKEAEKQYCPYCGKKIE